MKNLQTTRFMWLKAALFLLIGLVSVVLLMLDNPRLRTALCLSLAIWAFCRAYYFAFYVIEHYVDRRYRFSGLFDFVLRQLLARRKAGPLTGAGCAPQSDTVSRRVPPPHS